MLPTCVQATTGNWFFESGRLSTEAERLKAYADGKKERATVMAVHAASRRSLQRPSPIVRPGSGLGAAPISPRLMNPGNGCFILPQ